MSVKREKKKLILKMSFVLDGEEYCKRIKLPKDEITRPLVTAIMRRGVDRIMELLGKKEEE